MLGIGGRFAAIRSVFGPLAVGVALLLITGCSSLNPFGSDDSPLPLPPPLETDADGNVPDETGRKVEADKAEASDAEGEYPDLADVPEGDEATKSAEKTPEAVAQREELAGGLVADRDQAKYTDEELRGGKVAPVAPPRPQPAAPPPADSGVQAPAAPEPAASAPAPVQRAAPAPAAVAATPPTPQMHAAPAPAAVAATPPAPQIPRAQPPRAPVAAAPVQTAPATSSSSFQPSTAQPLPAELAAALPAGVAQRYQETLRRPVPGVPSALPVAPVMRGRGGGPFASIAFASGSSQLSSVDKKTIAQVVSAARNGFGAVRVVGHASSTAASQSESQRMFANWEVSQARATAVADELVRQGVDAARIIIEAVGDSQAGVVSGYGDAEAALRRVDVFLE